MKKKLKQLLASSILLPMGLSAQQNLLVNPGFEDGLQSDAPPWGVGGWRGSIRATTDDKHSGRRSLRMEGGGDEGGINSAVQIVPVDPTGQTKYHFRIWMRIPSSTAEAPKNGRTRWMFSEGTGGGLVTPLADDQWAQLDEGTNELIPPAGAQHIIFRVYGLTGRDAVYLDDCELVGEPTGNPSYPGITGVVKDANGNPVAGAVVFLKDSAKAQEFAKSSAVTDSEGKFTVCVADEGDYFAVAWKAGYNLSTESTVSLAAGTLKAFNPTITKGTGGRDLAISTAARSTAVGVTPDGTIKGDPQFKPEYVFDGNSVSSRYYNQFPVDPPNDRWIYVDLDPVGKNSYAIREFVLTWLGVTQNTQGWPGLGDVAAKDFTLEYTTGDPATEANWGSKVAYTATAAPATFAPVVLRLAAPITARAIRFRVTDGGFGPTEIEVNADALPRGTVSGVVKDATTGTPIAGARVVVWTPVKIQNDPDIIGVATPILYVLSQEIIAGTPYDIPVAKNIEQTYITDAQGRYTFDVHPGRPIRISALVTGSAYGTASVTPSADGTAAVQDFAVGKSVVLSGVVRNASGPLANALVQVGPPGSKYSVITGTDGSYNISVGAGTHELYADASGYAANIQSVTVSANTTKDITLTAAVESDGLNANFDANVNGWEIANYDTNWVALGTASAAVRSTTQNSTPGGSGSALVEDKIILAADGVAELPVGYRVMQLTAAQRVAVQSGKAYNVYFRVKAENWVTPEHRDAVHYQIIWRDAAGAVVGRILSHPQWIYPQPFWYICDRGHPAGADDSITLARLSPPAGAATLDVRIGWLRNDSAKNPDTEVVANPEGSQLFVDDLVIDAVGAGAPAGITNLKAVVTAAGKVKITFDGTGVIVANTGDFTTWIDTAIKSGDEIDPVNVARFYRAK